MHEADGRRDSRTRKSACGRDPTRPPTRAVPSRKSRMVQGFFDSDTPGPRYFWQKQRVQKPRHRFVDPAVQSVSALVAACILVLREHQVRLLVMLQGADVRSTVEVLVV